MIQRSLFEIETRPNRLIEAGAGTGKTTRLVTDVLQLLLDDPELDASRLVLMTFTEKAAGEIASRIRAAIVEIRHILESGGDRWPSGGKPIIRFERGQLRRAREAAVRHSLALDSIRSQTIHSFCQSILSRHPLESGVDPGFTLIEGVARTRLFNECFDEWLATELASPDADTVTMWRDALSAGRGTAHMRNAFRILHARRDILADERYSIGTTRQLSGWVRERMAVLAGIGDDVVASRNDTHVSGVVRLAREQPPNETDHDWDELVYRIGSHSRLNASRLPKAERWAWMELRKIASEGWLRQHRAAVAWRTLAVRYFHYVDQRKVTLGVVDFDDLLDHTDRLLGDSAVLASVRKRYDYYFVDEFQDTDRVQARILDRLARDRDGRLVAGRVTIVGDPKQSIYSFRRAEPEIFHQTVEQYSREGAIRESLGTQYRSDPPLLNAVNGMFSALFGSGARIASVVQPAYTPLESGRTLALREPTARIRFLGVQCSPSDGAIQTEAEGVAEWILQHRDRRESGPNGDLRRFAILLRKMTAATVWADVFERRGIELAMPPSAELLSQRGSTDLVAVLRCLADPLDRASTFSALRSIFFALTDDEIALGFSRIETSAWSEAMQTLRRWRRLAVRYGTSRVIDTILEETDLGTSLRLVHGGEQWMSRILRLREIAAQLDFAERMSPRDVVRELAFRRDESAESEPARPDSGTNAVRLMTVHAAKGLEFDTVILAQLGAQTQSGSTDAFVVEELRQLVMESPSSVNRFITSVDGHSLKELQSRRKTWERDRLFYVAVTRARTDVVFVSPVYDLQESDGTEQAVRESNSEFWKPISEIFGFERKELSDRLPASLSEEIEIMKLGGADVPVAFERLRPVATDEDRPRFTRGFDPLRLMESRESPGAAAEDDTLDAGEIRSRRASRRRRSWGSAVHQALELWGTGEPGSLAERVGRAWNLPATEMDQLIRLLATIARSPVWKRIRAAELIGRELPIVGGDSDDETSIGRLDLLVREAGGDLLVVDYKTGSPDQARIQKDADQVGSYCERVARMSGQPCRGLVWYVEHDRTVEVPVVSPETWSVT